MLFKIGENLPKREILNRLSFTVYYDTPILVINYHFDQLVNHHHGGGENHGKRKKNKLWLVWNEIRTRATVMG